MLNTFYDRFIFTNSLQYKHYNFFLSGVPFVIAPSAMLFGLARTVSQEFHKQLYYAVKSGVREELLKQFGREFRLNREKLIDFAQAYFTASGWGLFESQDINYAQKRAIVRVQNAPFSQFFSARAKHPVDSFLRAIIAAIFCMVFDENVDCVETACSAIGANYCSFVVKPLHDFDFSNKEVRAQLNPE